MLKILLVAFALLVGQSFGSYFNTWLIIANYSGIIPSFTSHSLPIHATPTHHKQSYIIQQTTQASMTSSSITDILPQTLYVVHVQPIRYTTWLLIRLFLVVVLRSLEVFSLPSPFLSPPLNLPSLTQEYRSGSTPRDILWSSHRFTQGWQHLLFYLLLQQKDMC